MKIVIAGGSGFLGEALVSLLASRGQVFILTRSPRNVSFGTPLQWSPPSAGAWEETVATADAVVNLAGESIAGRRWTRARREQLLRSRIEPTRALVRALKRAPDRERIFISASAIDIYRGTGDTLVDESAPLGEDFTGRLGREWEAAALEADSVARVAIARFAMILHPSGGALHSMLLPFRFGVGGPFAGGRQWMPWITRDDATRALEWMIDNPEARGAYNVMSPQPVTNREFTRALGAAVRRPAVVPVPRWALRLALGPMADEILLASHRAVPARLLDEGFTFRHEDLRAALLEMLG